MRTARVAGAVYLLVFVIGGFALAVRGTAGSAAGLVAGILYVAVTLLLYDLFKPVNKRISLAAASISLAGVAAGPLLRVNPLPLFGCYCLLIGFLIFRSTVLPRALGGLMAFAGVGWLTFLIPSLAKSPSAFMFAPGIIGEGALTAWLLLVGVDVPRWGVMKPDDARTRV